MQARVEGRSKSVAARSIASTKGTRRDGAGSGEVKGGSFFDRGRRRASEAEMFLSRLEGNRGPRNRRESIALFKRVLNNCPTTNNSAQLRDDCIGYTSRRPLDETAKNSRAPVSGGDAAAVREVFAEREESQNNLAKLMSVAEVSYMLSPKADGVRILLGRKDEGQ